MAKTRGEGGRTRKQGGTRGEGPKDGVRMCYRRATSLIVGAKPNRWLTNGKPTFDNVSKWGTNQGERSYPKTMAVVHI